jgi:hypothetical protein
MVKPLINNYLYLDTGRSRSPRRSNRRGEEGGTRQRVERAHHGVRDELPVPSSIFYSIS